MSSTLNLSCLASVWESEKNKDNDHNISSLSRRLRTVFLFSVKFLHSLCCLFNLFLLERSANERSNKTKKPTLLGDGCVEICLNEVMSPSPGELLF